MAKEIPAAATEIAKVAENAGQLGIQKDAILGFSRVMVDLGVATDMASDQAAMALARLAAITGMSQQDFDRLGSSIVALGNNFAATESEITEMGLRLAGAGTEIGLVEHEILAISTALTAVGINAEAGGTAFSKLMIDMAQSVDKGGTKLEQFARVAGMSATDFRRAFKDNAAIGIAAFIQGLGNIKDEGESTFQVLEDLGLTEVRLRDALLRSSNASDILTEALKISSSAWTQNNALTKEAAERYKTTESQLKIFWNKLKDVGIELGKSLAPALLDALNALEPFINQLKNMAKWFTDLSPGMQKFVMGLTASAMAIGPLMQAGGGLIESVGKISEGFSKVTGAIANAGGAVAVLSKSLAVLSGPIGIAIGALSALTVAGVALYNHMKKEAIPEVERFGKEVSESTQEAVGAYMELNDEATKALKELAWSGKEITEEMADKLVSIFDQMGDKILAAMQEDHAQQLEQLQVFFAKSEALAEEEEASILRRIQETQEERMNLVSEYQDHINSIFRTAAQEKRAITEDEWQQIYAIQEQMFELGIKAMSQNELEQMAIFERLRKNKTKISALQASEIVQNSREETDGAIAAAEEQYHELVKLFIEQRDALGSISDEQAQMLIGEAERQKDEVVDRAREMHQLIVEEAKRQAGAHVDSVNWETGEILSIWDKTKKKLGGMFIGTTVSPTLGLSGSIPGFAKGVENFRGGLAIVGEEGPELVNLPKGSSVIPNRQTEEILRGGNQQNSNTYNMNITIPVRDLQEFRDVTDFFNFLTQTARQVVL